MGAFCGSIRKCAEKDQDQAGEIWEGLYLPFPVFFPPSSLSLVCFWYGRRREISCEGGR